MTAVQQADAKPAATGGGRGLVTGVPAKAWNWGRAHPRLGVALAFTTVALAVPLLAIWMMRPAKPAPVPIDLARALAELDAGHDAAALQTAKQLLASAALAEGEDGGPSFVQGMVTSRQADHLEKVQQRRYSLLAVRYLAESRELGFPEGRTGQALFELGKNLFRSGQLEASVEALEAALPEHEAAAAEIHQMLCRAYLNEAPPDLPAALQHITAGLESSKLTADEREAAVLERACVLLRQGRRDECRQALSDLSADSPRHADAQILSARVLMGEAGSLPVGADQPLPEAVVEKFAAARSQLETLIETLPASDVRRAAALYQLGICCEQLGRSEEAKRHFLAVQEAFANSVEALAAGMQLAELVRQEHQDQEAVELLKNALGSFPAPDISLHNWLTLDEVRQRSLTTFQRYIDAGQFELALDLLAALERLIDVPVRLELAAGARRAWGQILMAQLAAEAGVENRSLRTQAEEVLRLAGQDYARLAELRFTTREYPDYIWASADCLLAAHDYPAARKMLVTYLDHEPARRRPLALIHLGECLLLENRPAKAVERIEEAIATAPTDGAIYAGRILASQAYLDLGDAVAAEKRLRENLDSSLLTPASLEWRDSLFALGRLLYLTNRYAEALPKLEEAVRRYPETAAAITARYLIGESYRQLALQSLQQRDAALVQSARLVHAREAKGLLESANLAYDAAAQALQSRRDLAPTAALVQRNCRYMKAATLFDLGRYEESIKTYSTAINQYQHSPDVLDAYVRVADCFRRLNRRMEARGTIEQAKVVLGRLPEETDFSQTSGLDRQEWKRYLDWLAEL